MAEPQEVKPEIATTNVEDADRTLDVGPRPYKTKKAYLTVARRTCSLRRWKEIVERAVDQAREGEPKARQWLTELIMQLPSDCPAAPKGTGPVRAARELVDRIVTERVVKQ